VTIVVLRLILDAVFMPHTLDNANVERLARLSGVHDFDEWTSQCEDQPNRIRELLDGSIAVAWANCLPTWLALGRVRDLSRAVRVPKYWPSFANNLGLAFADVYRDDIAFLIKILRETPVDSHEFLCAIDLLDFIVSDADSSDANMLAQLAAVDCPLSPVILLETANDKRYAGISTVGQYLRRRHVIENGDEVAEPCGEREPPMTRDLKS
jgi:hypothetical protein